MNGAVVRWEGTGTWTVDKICFDWSDPDVNVWVCTVAGDGPHRRPDLCPGLQRVRS